MKAVGSCQLGSSNSLVSFLTEISVPRGVIAIETLKPLPAEDYLAPPEKSHTNVQLLPPAQSDAMA